MAKMLPFYVCDSFTRTPFAGNPAGVFLDADDLSADQMRRMAAEVSLESAFVRGNPEAGWSFRYFTWTSEVDLCGHATVAAATSLVREGRLKAGDEMAFTCNAGALSARLTADGDATLVHLRQAGPSYGSQPDPEDLMDLTASLGATPLDLHPVLPPCIVSSGSPFLFVAVKDAQVVDGGPSSFEAVSEICRRLYCYGVYLFALDTRAAFPDPAVYSRCFAPLVGLPEDPVTGSASGALGYYLARYNALPGGNGTFATLQGAAMGRPGAVWVTVDRDAENRPAGVETAGVATIVAKGVMAVPAETY